MINVLLRELKFLGNMYITFIERLASAKTESNIVTNLTYTCLSRKVFSRINI